MGFVASSEDAQPKLGAIAASAIAPSTMRAMEAPGARRGKRGHMRKLWYVSGTLASTAGQLMHHLGHRRIGRRLIPGPIALTVPVAFALAAGCASSGSANASSPGGGAARPTAG